MTTDLFENVNEKLVCKNKPEVGLKCTLIWQHLAFGRTHSWAGVVTKILHTVEKDGYGEIEVRHLKTIKNPETGEIEVTDELKSGVYPYIFVIYPKYSKNPEWHSTDYYYQGGRKIRRKFADELTLDLDKVSPSRL